jgi:RNA polymerase sigma-70 factor (ECF subfamily)
LGWSAKRAEVNGDVNSTVLEGTTMVGEHGETELLRRAASGDRPAFDALYSLHRKAVFGFAWRFTRSTAAAEDITQDAFLSLLTGARRFRPEGGSLRNWLLGIARNLALKRVRKLSPETPLDSDAEASAPGPLKEVLSGEIEAAVKAAVGSLPLLQREALILFEYEGLALAEIAAITGADLAAVKSRLHRARERLRLLLAPLQNTGDKREGLREDDTNE